MEKFLEKCTVVKGKKAQELIDNYDYSLRTFGYRKLGDCYSFCSYYKCNAFDQIYNECLKNNGHGLTIPTFNTNIFTCAYLTEIGGKTWLIYHTPSYRYATEY